MKPDDKAPEPVDLHVGAMMRLRRRAIDMSQEDLGLALQVTAQQVQKYETAASRISASKLFAAAQALGVRVSYFFADLDQSEAGPHIVSRDEDISAFLNCAEARDLATAFPNISDAAVRKQFVGLARALSLTKAKPVPVAKSSEGE